MAPATGVGFRSSERKTNNKNNARGRSFPTAGAESAFKYDCAHGRTVIRNHVRVRMPLHSEAGKSSQVQVPGSVDHTFYGIGTKYWERKYYVRTGESPTRSGPL